MFLGRSNEIIPRRAQAAFTLSEVVIAVGLLAISFVSLYAGMSAGFAMTRVSRESLRATQIMVEKMEGIRLFNWNQVIASNMIPATFTERYYPGLGNGQASGITYTGTIKVTDPGSVNFYPPRSYDTNMRVVSVEIQWQSGNVLRNRRMSTLVSKNGLQNYVYDR